MNLFKKLTSLLTGPAQSSSSEYWITIRCNRCGEVIRTRLDLRNDLSTNYGEEGVGQQTYYCRKVIIGEKRCFQRIEAELFFDTRYQLLERKIHGGEFVEE